MKACLGFQGVCVEEGHYDRAIEFSQGRRPPIKTYWPAGGGRGQNPENTAQGHSGHNAIRP